MNELFDIFFLFKNPFENFRHFGYFRHQEVKILNSELNFLVH
jgi:hypothetical protein